MIRTEGGIERPIGIEVSDGSIHAALVRAGLGLVILPKSMAADAGLTGFRYGRPQEPSRSVRQKDSSYRPWRLSDTEPAVQFIDDPLNHRV